MKINNLFRREPNINFWGCLNIVYTGLGGPRGHPRLYTSALNITENMRIGSQLFLAFVRFLLIIVLTNLLHDLCENLNFYMKIWKVTKVLYQILSMILLCQVPDRCNRGTARICRGISRWAVRRYQPLFNSRSPSDNYASGYAAGSQNQRRLLYYLN